MALCSPCIATEIKIPDVDLGVITEGGVYNAKFTLKNSGSSAIYVDLVRASCGCIQQITPSADVEVKPWQSQEFEAQLNTANKRDEVKQTLTFSMHTDLDPRMITQASVRAMVEPFADFSGSIPNVLHYNLGDPANLKFEFTTRKTPSDFKLESTGAGVQSSLSFLDARHGRLEVSLATNQSGQYNGTMNLFCGKFRKEIPIKWSVKDAMVDRVSVACGFLKIGEPHEEIITLASTENFKILVMEDSNKTLQFKEHPRTEGGKHETALGVIFKSETARTLFGQISITVQKEQSLEKHNIQLPYSAVYY